MLDILTAEKASLAQREKALRAEGEPLHERLTEINTELAGIAHTLETLERLIAQHPAPAKK